MLSSDDPNPTVPRKPASEPPPGDTNSRAADESDPDPNRTTAGPPLAPSGSSTLRTNRSGPPDMAPPAPTDGVPGYVLGRELGRGGMGVVYQARHIKLNRVVALKMMLGGARVGRSDLIRFLVEAEAVAAVKHSNVVQVYDIGESGGRPYMALEFCSGGTLTQFLAEEREPVRSAADARNDAELLVQVARGVAAAHDLGIIHRDLKPGNVFRDADGVPKVADFGLAKRGDSTDVTQTGQVMGTPAYMSPEQAKGETKFVGPQADVWALGVMLYECLTGARPFRGTVQEILAKVQNAEPVPPRKAVPTIPRDLELICLKCLAKAPHERYPTAKELADDLDRFLNNEPIRVRPAGALERGYKWVRRKPVVAALYAAVAASVFLLAVGGALAWVADDARRAEREADREREKADLARQDAEAQKKDAVAARGEAEKQKKIAESARDTQTTLRATADEAAYRLKVATANQAWQDNGVLRALRLLSDTKPEHRNFEWRYVAGLCRSEVLTVRPGGRVGMVALSPDGRTGYLAGHENGTVRGYDLDTGKETVVYRPPAGKPYGVVLLPGGTRAVSSTRDGAIDVWNTKTGMTITQLRPAGVPVMPRLAVSPDGKQFGATLGDAVTVWDTEKLEKVRDVKVSAGPLSLTFHPDGRLLVGCSDGRLRAWDAEGQSVGTSATRPEPMTAVAVSPDGTKVWTGDDNGHVRTWDAADFKPGADFPAHDGRVWEIVFSPDGTRVLTGSLDQTAALWDAATLKRVRTFRGHIEDVTSAAFRADGAQVVTAGDGTMRVWDATRDAEARVFTPPRPPGFPAGRTIPVISVAFSPDGKHLAASSGVGVGVWEVATGRPVPEWPAPGLMSPSAVAFSPDGKHVAGGAQGRVWVRPFAGGEAKWFDAGAGFVTKVAFDPTGTRLAVSGTGGAARVIDLTANKFAWVSPNGSPGFAVAYSPDGKFVATVEGTAVCVRDAATGAPKHTLSGHFRPVISLAFSADSSRLVSGSQDTTAVVWNVATGEKELALRTHDHFIYGVAFSPDGKRLVDASGDKTVRMYDARSGDEVLTLKGHTNLVLGVAFSPTGHHLATCGPDGTVRLWSAPPDATAVVPKEADRPHDSN